MVLAEEGSVSTLTSWVVFQPARRDHPPQVECDRHVIVIVPEAVRVSSLWNLVDLEAVVSFLEDLDFEEFFM